MKIEEIIKMQFPAEMAVAKATPWDPFKGHRKGDDEGKSTFSNANRGNQKLLLKQTVDAEGLKIFEARFRCGEPTGFETWTSVHGEWSVEIKHIHGCLQPVAINGVKWHEKMHRMCSIVITKEPNGWCLASAYPGKSGMNVGKFLEKNGYKEGDIITSAYAKEKGIPKEFTLHIVKPKA